MILRCGRIPPINIAFVIIIGINIIAPTDANNNDGLSIIVIITNVVVAVIVVADISISVISNSDGVVVVVAG